MPQAYYKQSDALPVMFGVKLTGRHLFGLPERSSSFLLNDTSEQDPYRLYNTDLFPHAEFNKQGLYSSIPYLTAHTATSDASVLWYNAAETWVDILKREENNT